MKSVRPGLMLLLIQVVLVLSVAGKYLYERQTRPRLWSRATQFDPNLPLRGRYLGLQLLLDSCGLPRDAAHTIPPYPRGRFFLQWKVSLEAVNGKLLPRVTTHDGESLTLLSDRPCNKAMLSNPVLLFISDRAQLPLPLKAGQEVWVEVTVPESGPPRPIQIAVSSQEGFHPLKMN